MGAEQSIHPSGFVYLLSNEAMPSHFKIGSTSRSPYERAIELSDVTGVPKPFEVELAAFCRDCRGLEKVIHHKLSRERSGPNREFFSFADVTEARHAFLAILYSLSDELDDLGAAQINKSMADAWRTEFSEEFRAEIRALKLENEQTTVKLNDANNRADAAEAQHRALQKSFERYRQETPHLETLHYACLAWCRQNPDVRVADFLEALETGRINVWMNWAKRP